MLHGSQDLVKGLEFNVEIPDLEMVGKKINEIRSGICTRRSGKGREFT